MTAAWRLPRWPRRFAYPAAGLLLSIAMVAGLLTVEAWTTHRPPTVPWILWALRERPLSYA